MEIKKLLTLTESGSSMNLMDLESKSSTTVRFENMSDIFMHKAEEDMVAATREGNILDIKKGDIIVKSHCQRIYFTLPQTSSVGDILEKIKEIRTERGDFNKKEQLYNDEVRAERPVSIEDYREASN